MATSISYIGGTSGSVDLDETVFGEAFHEPLVHRAVMAELNAKRQGTSSTLMRGEVSMTGAKAWRQKGTGRARVGALSAPHRTGGGVTFGPKPRHYTVKINRKERRRALRSALSVHADRGSLAAVDPDTFSTPSTKKAAEAMSGFTPFGSTGGDRGRALLLLTEEEAGVALSFRNIPAVNVLPVEAAGVSDVIGAARLVASPAALASLTKVAAAPVKERSA